MKINGLYNIITFGAGFYAGYNEGRGIDIGNIKYLAEYAPTALIVSSNLLITKYIKNSSKFINKKLKDENFEILLNKQKNNYKDLNENLKKSINNSINDLEKQAKKMTYFNSSLRIGTITAGITFLGYATGKFTSQFN